MIAIVHSIYSQSVHAPARDAGLMDNDAERYCSNSARMNKFDFTTEKIGSVHITVFEIVAHCNVDNWIQLLT